MKRKAESPPPTRWIRSKLGRTYAYVVHTRQRDWRDLKLYRLRYLNYDVLSPRLWTLPELNDTGVRWLKRRPTRKMIEATK